MVAQAPKFNAPVRVPDGGFSHCYELFTEA